MSDTARLWQLVRIRDNPTLVQQLAAMVKNQNGKEKEGMSESAQQGRPVQ